MSLFGKSDEKPAPGSPVSLTAEEAVIALLFLVVTVDGSIAPEEEELVIATSNRMRLLRKLSIDEFNDAVQKVRDSIDASGREAVLAAGLAGAPADLRETIYALAADVALAEGDMPDAEVAYLRRVQEGLGVSDAMATKVLEVMRVKNLG